MLRGPWLRILLRAAQVSAGQLRKSPHQFSGVGSQSPLLWLTRGYAVLDGPTMPIVAEGDDDKAEPNDTYVPQLVASARAAVQVWPTSLTCVVLHLPASVRADHSLGFFIETVKGG